MTGRYGVLNIFYSRYKNKIIDTLTLSKLKLHMEATNLIVIRYHITRYIYVGIPMM